MASPMKTSLADVEGFRELWKREIGEELTPEKAEEYGENLLGLVGLVARWKSEKCR